MFGLRPRVVVQTFSYLRLVETKRQHRSKRPESCVKRFADRRWVGRYDTLQTLKYSPDLDLGKATRMFCTAGDLISLPTTLDGLYGEISSEAKVSKAGHDMTT